MYSRNSLKIAGLFLSLSLPCFGGAISCDISSVDAVKTSLIEASPFVGYIRKRGNDVPIKLVFEPVDNSIYAVGNLGNISQDGIGDRELSAKYKPDGRLQLKGEATGRLKLTLNANCQLNGKHTSLKPGSLEPTRQKINSKQAFSDYLVHIEKFIGKWRWGSFSNFVSFRFGYTNGELIVDFTITTSGGLTYKQNGVAVILLGSSLMHLPVKLSTHNAYTGPVKLWLNSDGSLDGLSFASPDPYVLKLKVRPEVK